MVGYGAPPVLQGQEMAGWGARFGAWLIDLLILIVGVIGLIIGGYLILAYFMGREGPNNGQTPGKQALGIRVIREDGQPWNFGTGLLRELVIKGILFWWVGGNFLLIPPLLDGLWPLWDEKKQALHDKLSQSYVVKA
jgi:uncharacterized RDD family membrane protein YckC